jgi:aspartate/methionine/tyrosine aminotransferase
MNTPIFKLKKFFSKHISRSSHLGLCFSDSENWTWQEILNIADKQSRSFWDRGFAEKVFITSLLQGEIAKQYNSLQPKNISLFGGAQESTYHVMRTLLKRGDHVIVLSPCYQFLEEIPKMCGANVEKIPLLREFGFRLDIELLKKTIRTNTKLLIINYPHNPTGKILTACEIEEIITLARSHGIYLFNDEVYKGLEIDSSKAIRSISDLYEKGIVVSSLSKPFGLPSIRIGWIASQSINILQQAANYRNFTSSRNSELSELMAFMVLRNQKKLLSRNINIISENLRILSEFFQRHSHSLSWIPPEGGTVSFPKLLLPISIDQFVEELSKETKVVLVPASVFSVEENAFRITFGKREMVDSLNLLESFLIKKEKLLS